MKYILLDVYLKITKGLRGGAQSFKAYGSRNLNFFLLAVSNFEGTGARDNAKMYCVSSCLHHPKSLPRAFSRQQYWIHVGWTFYFLHCGYTVLTRANGLNSVMSLPCCAFCTVSTLLTLLVASFLALSQMLRKPAVFSFAVLWHLFTLAE